MRHWWQLGTRNWSTSPGRSLASILSVALGVATIVTITSFYETARRAVRNEVVTRWLGAAHLSVHPPGAHWGTLDTALAAEVVQLDNVRHATARLRRRARLFHVEDAQRPLDADSWRVDAIGIIPVTEGPFLNLPNLTGRAIEPGERGVAVIEREAADLWGAELGDTIALAANREGAKVSLSIVGLFDTRRVAEFQAPSVYAAIVDVQELKNEPGAASTIDIMVQDTSPAALAQTQAALERHLDEPGMCPQCKVVSSAARQMVLDEAERMTRFILTLTAFVALLTSFFIILTTMSMSLFERRRLLGVMRCVGLTRAQLAGLVFIELMPLGLMGTMLGVLLGIGVNEATSRWAAHATVQLSTWGLGLAVASGIITTLVCTIILWLQVGRIAPLSAVNPHTQAPKLRYLYISGVVGVGLLAMHEACIGVTDQTRWLNPGFALAGAASLYLGYILIVPALVVLLGRPLARLVGPLLGVRRELAEDQFGRAPWRSTGVCWVLLVGLSLIVYLGIGSEAVLAIWDFPSRLPEAFVWSQKYVPGPVVERVRHAPGLRDVTIMTDVDCEIATPDTTPTSETDGLMKWLLRRLTRPVFVAAEPGRIYNIFKITFIEGNAMDTKAKFARGGYVLIPVQTSRTKQLHLGDHVTVTIKGISADFEIAGVIQSPALDLAVTAFQAESYMQFAAASAMLGTQQDLKDKFGLDVVSMVLGNLDLRPMPLPDWFEKGRLPDVTDDRDLATRMLAISAADELPEERAALARVTPTIEEWLAGDAVTPLPVEAKNDVVRYGKAFRRVKWRWDRLSREESWSVLRERLTLLRIAQEIDQPDAIVGSVHRLKQMVDRSIRQAMAVLTWLPSLLLPVAAIGIGNLMMVSVQIRARQIAILRAVGALRSQIIRLILAEAIALGILGAITGVAMGLHQAYSDNRVSAGAGGFYAEFIIPVGTIALGVALTIATCLIAGIIPARRAARSNILAALQTT